MNPTLPQWVRDAATLPLAFAQVREDPRLDVELYSNLDPQSTVIMIASGGDTAVCLSRLKLGRLILVDMNPAQLALARCKWHLAAEATREEALEWLGHAPLSAHERSSRIRPTLDTFSLPENVFGPSDFVAEHGPDFAGRYERVFDMLRQTLSPVEKELRHVLQSKSIVLQPDSAFGRALEVALADVMNLDNLVALFGSEATQNPRQPFASHFAERTRFAAEHLEPRTNPFLWQMFTGTFPSDVQWDWLLPSSWKTPLVEPEFVKGKMAHVLEGMPTASANFIHLSNILDWLSRTEATELLNTACRVLKPGGMVFIRQLNSSLDIPALPSGLKWDARKAAELQARDRSFFYPLLHLGRKP